MTLETQLKLALVVREFGARFVRYTLNIESGVLLTGVFLTPAQIGSLEVLMGGLEIADLSYDGQSRQYKCRIHGFASGGDTVARILRTYSGGTLSDPDDGVTATDSLALRSLKRLINRYFVDLETLIQRRLEVPLSLGLADDPDANELTTCIIKEASLSTRTGLPGSDWLKSESVFITATHGARRWHLSSIAESLLTACLYRSIIHGRPMTSESLRLFAPGVIEDVSSLLDGQSVGMPAAVATAGPSLETSMNGATRLESISDDEKVDVGEGYVRPRASLDHVLFPMNRNQIGMVWVTEEKTQLRVWDTEPEGDDAMPLALGGPSITARWRFVAESLLISSQSSTPPGWVITDTFISSVISAWGQAWSAGPAATPQRWMAVNAEEFSTAPEWHALLSEHPTSLDVARRRLTSAVASRNDLVDSLVDAVVSWESIFGGAPETTLRTTIPTARMLYSPDERSAALKSMRKAYGVRSRVVHGGQSSLDGADLGAARDQIVAWVLQLIRKLFAEHPDLLDKSATQRSEEILLMPDGLAGSSSVADPNTLNELRRSSPITIEEGTP